MLKKVQQTNNKEESSLNYEFKSNVLKKSYTFPLEIQNKLPCTKIILRKERKESL